MYPSVLGQVYHALVLYRNHRGNLFAHNDFLLIHLEIRDDSVGQSLIDDLQPSLGSRKSIGRSGDDHRLAVVGDAVGIGLCLDSHMDALDMPLAIGDGLSTAIDGPDADDEAQTELYDIQGRKLDNTPRLPKGIYIRNGRKVVIK